MKIQIKALSGVIAFVRPLTFPPPTAPKARPNRNALLSAANGDKF